MIFNFFILLLVFIKVIYCQNIYGNCTGGVQTLCKQFVEVTSPTTLDQCTCGERDDVVSCTSGNTEKCNETLDLYRRCSNFCSSGYDINNIIYNGLRCYKVSFPMSTETYCTMQENNVGCEDMC